MLTRIYAITFPDRKQLKEYLTLLEEAKKRDHKILGPQLDLFSLKEEAPGMPFIHPKGIFVWNQLIAYIRELLDKARLCRNQDPLDDDTASYGSGRDTGTTTARICSPRNRRP